MLDVHTMFNEMCTRMCIFKGKKIMTGREKICIKTKPVYCSRKKKGGNYSAFFLIPPPSASHTFQKVLGFEIFTCIFNILYMHYLFLK